MLFLHNNGQLEHHGISANRESENGKTLTKLMITWCP